MNARIDHVAAAKGLLPATGEGMVPTRLAAAQVHATLALVEQQHIANMQAERQALRNRAIGRHDDAARQHLCDATDLDGEIRKALGLS